LLVVTAYILIQTEVGKAPRSPRTSSTSPACSRPRPSPAYDVIVRAEARNLDELGKLVVARVQSVDGITRTLTCPVVQL
jgi:hypothetical protein